MSTISREELHRRVWETPLKQLAEQWGQNTRALTELCTAFDIPRPSSGYWTQKSFGKASPAAPLDCKKFGANYEVTLPQITPKSPLVLPKIKVPKRLAKPEPEIKKARALYHAPGYQYEYIWIAPYRDAEGLVAMSVSEAQFPRALRILDTLLKYFKKQGWAIGTERERRTYMNTVVIHGQTVCFRLREELKQQTRALSSKEQADKDAGRSVWYEKVNMPTGNLVITLEHYVESQQCTWRDRKNAPLEDFLPEVIIGMTRAALSLKEATKRHAEQHAQWEKDRQLHLQADQLRKEWYERIEVLLTNFEKWQRAEQCRRFIGQVKSEMLKQGPLTESQEQWVRWATDIADRLDPVFETAAADIPAWSQWCSFTEQLNEQALAEYIGSRRALLSNNFSTDEIEAGLKEMGKSDSN